MEIYGIVIFSIITYVILEKLFNYLKTLSNFLAIHDLYKFHAIFTENETYIVTGEIEVLSEKDKNKNDVITKQNEDVNNSCIRRMTIKNIDLDKTLYFKYCIGFKSNLKINELMKFYIKKAIFICK